MVWKIVGGLVTAFILWCAAQWYYSRHEKVVVRHLRNNTEYRAGKQYLSIASVAMGVGLGMKATTKAAKNSPLVFFKHGDEKMIGLYEKEKSIYSERGLLVM